jgi:zinc and cadmium transporter
MLVLLSILVSTILVSVISFVGVFTLLLKEKTLNKILLVLVAFSAGALLGGAFFHLLPEAVEQAGQDDILNIFIYLVVGFCLFFVLEHFINWHHCHKTHHSISAFSYLILISDGVHNLIDGIIIAVAFVFSVPLGIATTLAVAFHEIPQEIGDFGVLVYGGFKKFRALIFNFLSGLVAVIGGLMGFFLSEKIGSASIYLLAFAAGNFIYIGSADLVPEIKQKCPVSKSLPHFFAFLLGIIFMLLIRS